MYKERYKWMVSKIGPDAAKAGVRLLYANILLVVVVWADLIIVGLGPIPKGGEITLLYSLIILAALIGVYARVRFARSLSKVFQDGGKVV